MPEWDAPKEFYPLRPMKLHKSERTREDRAQRITKAMKDMPAKEAKHRAEVASRKPKPGVESTFKRILAQGRRR